MVNMGHYTAPSTTESTFHLKISRVVNSVMVRRAVGKKKRKLLKFEIIEVKHSGREVNGSFVARGHARPPGPYEVKLSPNWVSKEVKTVCYLFTISADFHN